MISKAPQTYRTIFLILILALSGCETTSPTSAPIADTENVSGAWSGTWQNSDGSFSEKFTINLIQYGTNISGSGKDENGSPATVNGTLSNNILKFKIIDENGFGVFTGTVAKNEIQGNWKGGPLSGTFYLRRDHQATIATQPQQVSPELEKELIARLRRHMSRGFFVTENIPEKKLNNAMTTSVVPSNETVFALIDTTLFGSAKNNLIIGSSGIYLHNDWAGLTPGRHFVPFDVFRDLKIEKQGMYEVSIGYLKLNISGSEMPRWKILNLLLDVQKCVKEHSV